MDLEKFIEIMVNDKNVQKSWDELEWMHENEYTLDDIINLDKLDYNTDQEGEYLSCKAYCGDYLLFGIFYKDELIYSAFEMYKDNMTPVEFSENYDPVNEIYYILENYDYNNWLVVIKDGKVNVREMYPVNEEPIF